MEVNLSRDVCPFQGRTSALFALQLGFLTFVDSKTPGTVIYVGDKFKRVKGRAKNRIWLQNSFKAFVTVFSMERLHTSVSHISRFGFVFPVRKVQFLSLKQAKARVVLVQFVFVPTQKRLSTLRGER